MKGTKQGPSGLQLAAAALLVLSATSYASDFSGWRGGIGITFGTPSRDIRDVTELGYEIVWGSEELRAIHALEISFFRYWNSIVETSLKGNGYDFSQLPDKEAAAKLAFDAWMERTYGVKGLSQYATVRYKPDGAYGDVYGSMDLSSENDLVRAVVAKYLGGFEKDGIRHGGIGLDNAGKVPQKFLETLAGRLNERGLGIAANGCPDEYLRFIDFFGNEGFPFSIDYARQARSKGLRGILGEFTMQHLSGGELEAYLKSKLFNGIVFFGYTNGGTAAGARYSSYCSRPDVYDHQRWVFRKLVPVSRAVQRAGREAVPGAKLASETAVRAADATASGVTVNAEGKVAEVKRGEAGLNRITGRSPATPPALVQFGSDASSGIYLFVDSGRPEDILCDAKTLGLDASALVFEEFTGSLLEARREHGSLRFRTTAGPSVVQLASASLLARNLVNRAADTLTQQLTQRKLDRSLGTQFPRKAWSRFCQAGKWDAAESQSGKGSLALAGGTYTGTMPQWKYFNRQGASQFVRLNQATPQPIVASAFSKARNVASSEPIVLDTPAARRHHFDAREGRAYCLHLYLDYQDGQWPEVHTVSFSPGTHDWEPQRIRVEPARPVKTAMVLLEFHQPAGDAWFDEVSLTSGGSPNLLASSGFELQDPAATKAEAVSTDYESRVQHLLESLRTGAEAPALPSIRQDAEALASWLTDSGLAPWFPRELRDLDEMKSTLERCEEILARRRS